MTNFHGFLHREKVSMPKATRELLGADVRGAFTETPDQMVRRVCRDLGTKKNIVVLNDEAHHCYRRKPDDEDEIRLDAEDRAEVKQRDEEARVWLSGLEATRAKLVSERCTTCRQRRSFSRVRGTPRELCFRGLCQTSGLLMHRGWTGQDSSGPGRRRHSSGGWGSDLPQPVGKDS